MGTVSSVSSAVSAAPTNSQSYTGMSFGAAQGDRYLIACIATRCYPTGSVDSVTIGGVTATLVVKNDLSSGDYGMTAIYMAAVPTGTSGTVVVNTTGTIYRQGVALFAAEGIGNVTASTGTDSAVGSGGTCSAGVTLTKAGFIIAVDYGANSFDGDYLCAASGTFNAGSFTVTADNSSLPPTWSFGLFSAASPQMEASSGNNLSMAVAAWTFAVDTKLSATGSASATFVGTTYSAPSDTALSATGTASATFRAEAIGAANLTATGSASATFSSAATDDASLSASGTSSATFVGSSAASAEAAMSASGTASATFSATSTADSGLSASGSASAIFNVGSTADATASMSGISSADFSGESIAGETDAALSAQGYASADFSGAAIGDADLSSAASSDVTFSSVDIAPPVVVVPEPMGGGGGGGFMYIPPQKKRRKPKTTHVIKVGVWPDAEEPAEQKKTNDKVVDDNAYVESALSQFDGEELDDDEEAMMLILELIAA